MAKRAAALVFLLTSQFTLMAWGFYGHKKINSKAIFALPVEMFLFYKLNASYLENHAVDPDKRRYIDKKEAPRHYIDLDHYIDKSGKRGVMYEIEDTIPLRWKEAKERFTEDTLNAYGILPWILNMKVYQLTQAFLQMDEVRILKLSAEIGHYAADGHVPLHTTENYNGQLTGQHGIHALWESRIPERHGENYDFLTGKAFYLDDVQKEIWGVIASSHENVEFVLSSERELRKRFNPDAVYRPVKKGRAVQRDFSVEYVDAYADLMGDLVERRMTESALFVASLWYTAWVNAGQPELNGHVTRVNKEQPGSGEEGRSGIREHE